MHPIIRNILAVVIGWLAGSAVNMGLIMLGNSVFPIEGLDVNDMDAYAAIMPTLGFKNFIFPFLAHAVGTFIGAAIAFFIAVNRKMTFALVVGGLFLLGGIAVNYMLPGPLWFTILDIVVAYLPMAWIGGKVVNFTNHKTA